ncbi:gluconate 2-dehydrogenase subunit 3 family protein [Sporosarcina sp. ANT_H38]|uniref:gluconate 2-dehydrogenase subunit 3 family protein n=1 Tax=Sporosarcina sp. ANT_H38 TaxID=2597358 RepID=UPI0011F0ADDB|nr:gluconate 2-dehydrogenase subunit 3 family protein [Sporosarcina sp. ANT_H38]KAA0966306.1 gluconate 2-dehydrogenase subunit 3 family protein [Sporosarcina sp. ANT_H38]
MTKEPSVKNEKEGLSRRQFLKNSGLVAGGVVGGSLFGGLLTKQFQKQPVVNNQKETANLQEARMFFSRKEDFEILSAATERIFPKNDNGPGAIELAVPFFIDKQLAGSWGINAKEYMKGPFIQTQQVQGNQDKQGPNTETQLPTPTARYQTRLNRGEIFILGLRKLDSVSQEKFGMKFVEAKGDQQDEVLHMFEENKVSLKGVDAKTFFSLLLQSTLEGAYADPLYGGNKDMMGWKMKEYPGPRMGYLGQIEEKEFIVMNQESLKDYQVHG